MIQPDKSEKKGQSEPILARRRVLVHEGLSKMMTVVQIQAWLVNHGIKVSKPTVNRDIILIRKELVEEITKSKEPLTEVLSRYLTRHNKTYKEADKLLESTEDDKVRARCIEIMAKMEDNWVKVMQTLGIVTNKAGDLTGEIVIRWRTKGEQEKIDKEESK